ncbi:MAG TPA: proline dehydrogenase family protein, partial [Nitrospiria bacterium]
MDPSQTPEIERETQRIGREILNGQRPGSHSLFSPKDWRGKILRWSMENEALRTALFRFVDVLPNLTRSADMVRIFREYLDRPEVPSLPVLSWGIKTLVPGSPTVPLAAKAIRSNVETLAATFIAGPNLEKARGELGEIGKAGASWSVSMRGEVAVSEEESRAYQALYLETLNQMAGYARENKDSVPEASDRFGRIPRANLAVKISSLFSQMDPLNWEGSLKVLSERLGRLLIRARELGVHLHVDMEHYAFKDLTLEAFFRAMEAPELSGFNDAGVVLQAYLRDSDRDMEKVIAWAKKTGKKITVRLVRGAYWDSETVIHRQNGWPIPVFLAKGETDARYEELALGLFEASDAVRAAFGTHNIRSIARCVALARARGVSDGEYEFQVLYGMAGPLQKVLTQMGLRVRVYTPVGELITGMSYLVRRLLENTSNESFLRNYFVEEQTPERVLAPPAPAPAREKVSRGFRNEPPLDFRVREVREKFTRAIESVKGQLGKIYPAFINGNPVRTSQWISSLNPARPSELVGQGARCGTREADLAVSAAKEAGEKWGRRPAAERAALLRLAAENLRARRYDLAAWEVMEVGKTWREADGDVTEAIDFLTYYALEIERLAPPRKLGRVPGEQNVYSYFPMGIALVIAPWNFPLAIPAGMVSAALAAGNSVIFKPSELSPVMGHHLFEAFKEAGLPEGVLSFLPGKGEEVGDYLVRHPEIGLIVFTGSREVGLGIIDRAGKLAPGQRHVKRVIAEMGGKNAIIVDETADLDHAVPGVVQSVIGYSGQKCSACSRVIVLESVYDAFVLRLEGALRSVRVGNPEKPATQLGPVIEDSAKERLRKAVADGAKEGRVVFGGEEIT